MAKMSETFLDRLLHHAAQQGIAITEDIREIIVKTTEEIAALDKRLERERKKRARLRVKPSSKRKISVAAKKRKPAAKRKVRRKT